MAPAELWGWGRVADLRRPAPGNPDPVRRAAENCQRKIQSLGGGRAIGDRGRTFIKVTGRASTSETLEKFWGAGRFKTNQTPRETL